jgi:hypothetical protein
MRTEDIKKKTDDYNFIEELKIKREGLMNETSKKEDKAGMETLFDKSSLIKNDDMTPVINTDVEMEYPKIDKEMKNELIAQAKADLGFDDEFNMSIADTTPIKEEKFQLSREGDKEEKFELSREGDKEAKKAEKNRKKKEGRKEKKKSQI